ncbi:MAG: 1-deoxy-D-xylulose-5-phosphate reductoisomerase [Planctomycetales bacterium]|nr:1-deoxy-D-xylulose-5-phosphate reductoisomerase [Planctomycetales bacterium]
MAVLGATGSIGSATLDVIRHLGSPWRAAALTAHSQIASLMQSARQMQPDLVAITDDCLVEGVDCSGLTDEVRLLRGAEGLVQIAQDPRIGTVVAAVVGSAGLPSTLAAAKAGKRLALANKEALVVAGELVMAAVRQHGGELIPVDSEHSAIFQALRAGSDKQVARIVLTASGGPFRNATQAEMNAATVQDALAHPTWQMGRKITIDSATMMNKALEIIEARWLFGIPSDKIQVVIHPQSIVHSMVEFTDGSVVAQLSPPDMRLPIQYALTYPDRLASPCPKMNFAQPWNLEFLPADPQRFPALTLGWEVANRGGSTGAVLNAANEAAVGLFLAGKIKFPAIVAGCRRILEEHNYSPSPELEELMRLDQWAREEIHKWAAAC